jgi:hypothetical protein
MAATAVSNGRIGWWGPNIQIDPSSRKILARRSRTKTPKYPYSWLYLFAKRRPKALLLGIHPKEK